MVEPKLALLEVQKEVLAPDAATFRESRLGRAPEAFNAIDVHAAARDKHAVAVLDAEVFAVPDVDQAGVADPAVRVNDTGQIDASAHNPQQSGPFRIRHDLRVDAPVALEDAKDDGLAARPTPALTADAAPPEVRFIDLDHAAHRRMRFALARHTDAKRLEEAVDRAAADVGQCGNFRGLEIERKQADDRPKFGFRNM